MKGIENLARGALADRLLIHDGTAAGLFFTPRSGAMSLARPFKAGERWRKTTVA
ncbi:MAG: hypothetical protein ACT4OT_03470 [Acidobacteriota bacterium]